MSNFKICITKILDNLKMEGCQDGKLQREERGGQEKKPYMDQMPTFHPTYCRGGKKFSLHPSGSLAEDSPSNKKKINRKKFFK